MYAVSQKDIRDSTPISSWKWSLILDSDEDFEPRSKKERKEEKLDMILSEVGGIKEALGEVLTAAFPWASNTSFERHSSAVYVTLCPSTPL